MIHLRSYAQKKPIDEYKQEAFLLFERLLVSIREEVTRILMQAQVQLEPQPPVLPDFITQHIDPFAARRRHCRHRRWHRRAARRTAVAQHPQPPLPLRDDGGGVVEAPISRNAPCPCGSGKKYKHCHGQPA